MKFFIYRTSDYKGEVKEINTLEELLKLRQEVGEALIIWGHGEHKYWYKEYNKNKLPEIEIYDDYRE